MEELIRQKRVSFSGQPHGEYYHGDEVEINHDYNTPDSEFAAAVAAATLTIYSLHEAEEPKRGNIREKESKTRKEGSTIGSGEKLRRKPSGEDPRRKESSLPNTKVIRSRSRSSLGSGFEGQRQTRNSQRQNDLQDKADSWERIQMQKINERYEKTKSLVLVWENEKKIQAELQKQRKQNELEQRMMLNFEHYKSKLARIDKIVGQVRADLEEKRKNDENKAKEKSKKIRSTGEVPVKCFCF